VKPCTRCKRELPLDDFGKDSRYSSGRKSWCRKCQAAVARASYRADPEPRRTASAARRRRDYCPDRRRDAMLRHHYGLTLEAFAALLRSQGSCCAICGSGEPRSKNWNVDHCHESERVRGVLCGPCNTGLGHLGDDPERLESAIRYLKERAL
jgi:hypothetical protein